MSSKLHGLVWECDIQPISRKAVIARLADFSSDEGYSWPSVDTIRRQVGAKSKNTVAAAIKELEKDGWLTVVPRKSGGRDISNGYQLNVEKIEVAADESRQSVKQARAKINSKFNPSNIDPSDSDHSKNEGSKKVKSRGQNLEGEGSTVDPDPLLDPTTDPSNKNTSCPVAAQPDVAVVITDQAKQVLTYLNQKTGSRYQVSKSSLDNIRARLGDGFTVAELELVVDYTTAKWGQDLRMAEYLRPTTLFLPSKFPGYLQAANKWVEAGRPERRNGEWVSSTAARASFQNVDYSLPENAGFRS
ncbi:conserved phage C-terminal domain-containing protein [Kosakonia sp. YIM B13611]|uniref:conserved phage C-terminal domain-containing protein n=1 Tax=unclassified Kosakonia TaxID=2632876 RepID=UPI0036B46AC6